MKLHKGWQPGLAKLPAPASLELSQALMGRGCQSWTIGEFEECFSRARLSGLRVPRATARRSMPPKTVQHG